MIAEIVGEIVKLAVSPALKRLLKKRQKMRAPTGREPVVVVEIGRPIVADVESFFGKDRVVAVISAIKQLEPSEFPVFAANAYKALKEVARGIKGPVNLVLSGPVALNFQFGQLVGLNHVDVRVWQWFAGEYKAIPPVRRELLK